MAWGQSISRDRRMVLAGRGNSQMLASGPRLGRNCTAFRATVRRGAEVVAALLADADGKPLSRAPYKPDSGKDSGIESGKPMWKCQFDVGLGYYSGATLIIDY